MFLGLTSTSATEIASGKFSHGQLAPGRISVRFVLYYLCGAVACIVRDVLGPVGEGIGDYITGLLLFPRFLLPSLPCLRRSSLSAQLASKRGFRMLEQDSFIQRYTWTC